jgi:hypothetical protein
MEMRCIFIKEPDAAQHAIALSFDQSREEGQDLTERSTGENEFENGEHSLAGKQSGGDIILWHWSGTANTIVR